MLIIPRRRRGSRFVSFRKSNDHQLPIGFSLMLTKEVIQKNKFIYIDIDRKERRVRFRPTNEDDSKSHRLIPDSKCESVFVCIVRGTDLDRVPKGKYVPEIKSGHFDVRY